MEFHIDRNNLHTMMAMILRRWAGLALNADEDRILNDFIQTEVEPLDRLELLRRTGTPAQILAWFFSYLHSRTLARLCEGPPVAEDGGVCCVC
jgi:hypothetical protein